MSKLTVGFGEVMLRLAPPERKRFGQALPGSLNATFGGAEANLCASLAMLGGRARYVTRLPDHPIARALVRELASFGVDTARIDFAGPGRLGVYYVEFGASLRGAEVVYDREHSAVALAGPETYDFDALLEDAGRLHLSGITPALSRKAFETTLALAQAAASRGVAVSCDLNFRKKLWNWEPGTERRALAGRCMAPIAATAELVIGNEEDAFDVFGIAAADSDVEAGKLDTAAYGAVAGQLAGRFPQAKFIAFTLRESHSADDNGWGGMLYDCRQKRAFFAPLDAAGRYAPYRIRGIVDRFGGGDAFAAGLLHALDSEAHADPAAAVAFAAAAAALKHTVYGDYNRVTEDEVLNLMRGNASGRVKR